MTSGSESHLVRERRAKVERLRAQGREPFPWQFDRRVPTAEVAERCRQLPSGGSEGGSSARVAGRLIAVRSHGKTSFFDLEDASGSLQLFLRVDDLGESEYRYWLEVLDPGDIVGADGVPMLTRRGEPSLKVRSITLLAKALAPPPEKYHGLKDPEERLRRRYADLLSSAETRARFEARGKLVHEVREFLENRDFLGVETPVLLPVASGAAAAPFVAHSNYLEEDLQLRIALELPLKRLLVGGLERVYEIGPCFRNEDMDSTHSPEFTMLEVYWAYADYSDMRELVQTLYGHLAVKVAELLPELPGAREAPALFRTPFDQIDYAVALEQRSGMPDLLSKSREELRTLAKDLGTTVPEDSPKGKFIDKLFERYVEPTLQRPTFVLDFPEETTPLAKRHRSRPGFVERFEVFCRGFEVGNAYTELNDPDEQERRFRGQLAQRSADAYAYDADFVEALRYGMPPAAGFGVGIERILMALTGISSIKDVVLFPQTRRRSTGPSAG